MDNDPAVLCAVVFCDLDARQRRLGRHCCDWLAKLAELIAQLVEGMMEARKVPQV
jgi:hypothetical protein